MSAPQILFSVDGPVGTVLLNRPEKRNALSRSMIAALKEALSAADAADPVRVIVLRGAGDDFCSGLDLAELREGAAAPLGQTIASADSLAELFGLPRRLRKPVIAVVRGRALAGGCGLATACDLVLAAEGASFGYPEVKIGFAPAIVAGMLRRNLGEKRAFELIARGDAISAAEAERIGLINHVYPDAELDGRAGEYVAELASRSGIALELCKRVLYQQDGLGFEAAMRAGADINVLARMSDDLKSGVDRFLTGKPARPEG